MVLHVFSQHIAFEVDRVARFAVANVGVFVGVGNHGDFREVVPPAGYGEADAVNGDRALRHDVAGEFRRDLYSEPPIFSFGREMRYAADGVHVAEDKVPCGFLPRGARLLEIDPRTLFRFAALRAIRSLAYAFTRYI